MTTTRLYRLAPTGDFYVGHLADGRQVLLGLLCPEVVAFFFDAHGRLLERHVQKWRHPAPRFPNNGPYQIHDPAFREAMDRQIEDWTSALGVRAGTISVRKFFEAGVGIDDFPDHLEPLEDESPSETQERLDSRKAWEESGRFVFWWGKDYFMSKDGLVEST